MSNKEGEKFGGSSDDEAKAQDEALQKELSDMLKNVELDEGAAFNKEQESAGAKVMSIEGRAEINKEIEFFNASAGFSKDLIDHGGDYRWMPLRSIIEDLTNKNEVDKLIETSPPESRFHNMPPQLVSGFANGMKLWIKKGVLRGDMQLAEAVEALEHKREEKEELLGWSDMLIKRKVFQDQLERNRTKLERLCEAIDIAVHGNVRSYEATREKGLLALRIAFKERADADAFAVSLPGIIDLMQNNAELTFSAQFDETLLDEMQKRFKWIH